MALRLHAQPGSSSVGFGARGGDGGATRAVQSFVPARFAPLIIRAAQRWSVSAQLLAAQLYAESGFNPFARSPAGAEGIAQFMPGTAEAMGLLDPFDPDAAIDAQAHLMRDLLGRFGSVPLALAAYNAGPGAVAACGCIPPFPETRAYVDEDPRPPGRRRRARGRRTGGAARGVAPLAVAWEDAHAPASHGAAPS